MQRTSTTRLPAALREQIEQEPGQNIHRRPKHTVDRKQARRQERQQHKQRRAEFFSRSKAATPQLSESHVGRKRAALEDRIDEGHMRKKPRRHSPSTSPSIPERDTLKRSTSSTLVSSYGSDTISKKKSSQGTTVGPQRASKSSEHRSTKKANALKPHEEDAEDKRIAWLEAKLGMAKNKSGKMRKSEFGDGLDDLFDDLDRIIPTTSQILSSESEAEEESDTSEFEGFSALEEKESLQDERVHRTDGRVTSSGSRDEPPDSSVDQNKVIKNSDAVAVDILAANAAPGSRYIPPHLRQRSTENSESLTKLSRQLKGLLNRLSEQNMGSILSSIEELYRNHRRNDMTSTLTDLVIDGISSHSSLLDSFVVLHASLVASLYKIMGVDFGAHFVQCLISSYEKNYQTLRATEAAGVGADDPKGKECLNLVVLLSELHNFQVISCVLVYDIIRGLLDRLDEFDVEILLKIARNSGQQLRQDDPSALKDIIQMVQAKMSDKEQSTISSRTSFMVETLTNLKNNKVKRTTAQDGRSESTDRMKKFISGLSKKHHILTHEPLRVTLEDLHSSEKKGKWWLVGSAWGGDPLIDRAQEVRQPVTVDPARQAADALLKLARKQGMNTDVRRSIFVVLMSSEDYVDACQRLSQLNLSEVQQREIVRVNLHCLGNEKMYNPYYTLVVQQLCKTSHSYKVTLQFCLWDFLRDLGEKGVGGQGLTKNLQDEDSHIAFDINKISSTSLVNVARAYAWWIAKGCSSLTILKPVDFAVLQPKSRDFLRTLFLHLFISSQVSSPVVAPNEGAAEHLRGSRTPESLEEIFIKATRVPTLAQGLLYWLTTVLRGDDESNSEVVSETLKWARGVARDTLRTGMDVASLM